MQITIFGATGSVGSLLIDEAVKQGHTVMAVSRHPHVRSANDAVQWLSVDYENVSSIAKTLEGSNAAIISLGDYDVVTPTANIAQAMIQANVRRIELLTGFGTSPESRQQLGIGMRAMMNGMRPMLRTKEKQDKIIRNAGLDFTIVQPPTLTNGAATHAYRYGDYPNKSINGHISRADLSEFMITNLTNNRYEQESVYIQD